MFQKKLLSKLKGLNKRITPLNLSKFFLYAFVFLLPFNINLIIYGSAVYEAGNFNTFTSIFIYLTDFVFLISLICWGIAIFRHEFKEKFTYGHPLIFILFVLFLIFCEFSVLFSEDKWLSLTIVLRFVQLLILYFYIVNKTVKLETLINVFLLSVTFQGLIAIFQYLFQSSLGLGFLGESNINASDPGVAKIDTDSGKILRPYGTLPHPNILAGYLLTGLFLAYYKIKQKNFYAYPIIVIIGAAFILAFSRGAFLAFIIAALVYFSMKDSKLSFKYILLVGAFLFFVLVLFNLEGTVFSRILFSDISSINERIFYFNASKSMFIHNPLGIGLGNFTLNLPDFTSLKLEPWQFQPVHNAYMLLINEIGILGALNFIILFFAFAVTIFTKMKSSVGDLKTLGVVLLSILSGLFVIGMFDHYTVSLFHGVSVLFLIFAVCGRYLVKENH